MSRQIQIRRGTATEHENFTGAVGEVTMDTTNKTLRVHDGQTAGGIPLAKQSEIPDLTNADCVLETQLPTAENNYTWYRKYKSGWVEQGGIVSTGRLNDGAASSQTVTFPITMADAYYKVVAIATSSSSFNRVFANFGSPTTTTVSVGIRNIGGTTNDTKIQWSVVGMSA
ncbi:MAG: hypothetical protein J6W79_03320 [Alphaproteobacteria bacterium]|nr:hypothetical protein [Alphaproteobacteria bacterium]